MKPTTRTISAAGADGWYPLNHHASEFNVGYVVVVKGSGAVDFAVQKTYKDVLVESSVAAADIIDITSGQTTTYENGLTRPCAAIRVNASALASGASLHFTVVQNGV